MALMQSGVVAVVLGGLWLVLVACSEPSLDVPRPTVAAIAVELEPPGPGAELLRLFRARLAGAPALAEPWLFRGELSSYHAQALRRAELSATLRERAQPLRFWREHGDLWLQPLRYLELGQAYTLALTGTGVVRVLRVAEGDSRVATRLFPSAGEPITSIAVFCEVPEAESITRVTLEPGSVAMRVSPGVGGTPEAFAALIDAETKKWARVVKEANIKVD